MFFIRKILALAQLELRFFSIRTSSEKQNQSATLTSYLNFIPKA